MQLLFLYQASGPGMKVGVFQYLSPCKFSRKPWVFR